jgi:hypothetical protein
MPPDCFLLRVALTWDQSPLLCQFLAQPANQDASAFRIQVHGIHQKLTLQQCAVPHVNWRFSLAQAAAYLQGTAAVKAFVERDLQYRHPLAVCGHLQPALDRQPLHGLGDLLQ